MSDLNLELLSRYADGQVTSEEARLAEELVASDPEAAAALDEFRGVAELFGVGDGPDPITGELAERLYELRPIAPLQAFKAVSVPQRQRPRWLHRVAAVAAMVLVAIGIQQLSYRPEVLVKGLVRQALYADGRVKDTRRQVQVRMRAGDRLETGPGERISFRLEGGTMVILLEGSRLSLGDPRDAELVEIDQGTALLTVTQGEPRLVRAGDYVVRTDRADFGVRVQGSRSRSAGPALAADDTEVTIAVSRGSCEVGSNGDRREIAAGRLVVLRGGKNAEDAEGSPAWEDPLYGQLLSTFQSWGREVVPGFYTTEMGVSPISKRLWFEDDGGHTLVVTPDQTAATSHYLLLYLKASEPTRCTLTRVLPYKDAEGMAEEATVQTALVGTDWTLVAVRRDAFDASGVERKDRKIPAGFSRYARLELRPVVDGATCTLKSSLWAARPPATKSLEVVR